MPECPTYLSAISAGVRHLGTLKALGHSGTRGSWFSRLLFLHYYCQYYSRPSITEWALSIWPQLKQLIICISCFIITILKDFFGWELYPSTLVICLLLCQGLFFNKVECLRPATLFKKRRWHRCFPVNFAKFLRTSFLQNTSRRLLLITFAQFLVSS